MAPKRNKRKQQRAKRSEDRVDKKTLVSKFDEMEVGSSSTAASQPTPSASEPQPSTSSDQAQTNVLMSKYPFYDQWETMEEEERQRVRDSHASQVGPLGFRPNYLPVRVHIAAPQQGRFTREVESSMIDCNTLEAVKDIAKSSLVFELVRTDIDPARARFAGLMTYGPTNEFSDKTIRNHTRGLFLDADVYKQWWLQTNMTQTYDGEMVKIAVVLWDQDEALAKRIKLPDFWTEQNARILADHLQNLEMPIWDLEFEEGCRTIIKMQEQVLESRIEAANAMKGDWKIERKQLLAENDALKKDKAKLKAQLDAIAAALEEGDMTEAARLVAAAKKQDKGKGKGKEAAVGNEEDADADEDVETEEREDPYDEDYED